MAKKRLPKNLSDNELNALLKTISTRYPSGKRDRAMIMFMADTGARISEALNANVGDINYENGVITIIGKGDKERTLYLTPRLMDALRAWNKVKPESSYIFCTLKGGQIVRQHVNNMLRRRGGKAQIKHTSPHMLRHTFGRRAISKAPLEVVQDALGHADPRTTRIYTEIADERRKALAMNL